jgi:hypothetical protein
MREGVDGNPSIPSILNILFGVISFIQIPGLNPFTPSFAKTGISLFEKRRERFGSLRTP